jgi:hypothetical protein
MMRSIKWKELACVALIVCLGCCFFAGEVLAQTKAAAKVFKWRFQTHWPAASASYVPF